MFRKDFGKPVKNIDVKASSGYGENCKHIDIPSGQSHMTEKGYVLKGYVDGLPLLKAEMSGLSDIYINDIPYRIDIIDSHVVLRDINDNYYGSKEDELGIAWARKRLLEITCPEHLYAMP